MTDIAAQQQKEREKSLRQTTEQERAKFAWDEVSKLPQDLKGEYKDVVRKFPSLIINNGLGQALAFLLAKGTDKDGKKPDEGKVHGRLYAHIQEWICNKRKLIGSEASDPLRLIKGLVEQDSTRYRHISIETLALATWLKRFAEALAPED